MIARLDLQFPYTVLGGAQFGPQVFAHKLAADGSALLYARVYGAAERGFDKGSSGHAIAVDADGMVWSGSSTGYIHVYNPSTGALQVVRDIAVSSQTSKQINGIVAAGDDGFGSREAASARRPARGEHVRRRAEPGRGAGSA